MFSTPNESKWFKRANSLNLIQRDKLEEMKIELYEIKKLKVGQFKLEVGIRISHTKYIKRKYVYKIQVGIASY